jgi:hypothetical protein
MADRIVGGRFQVVERDLPSLQSMARDSKGSVQVTLPDTCVQGTGPVPISPAHKSESSNTYLHLSIFILLICTYPTYPHMILLHICVTYPLHAHVADKYCVFAKINGDNTGHLVFWKFLDARIIWISLEKSGLIQG